MKKTKYKKMITEIFHREMYYQPIETFIDEWKTIEFEKLESGDIFRLRNPDTLELYKNKDKTDFIAIGKPYQNSEGVWAINILL